MKTLYFDLETTGSSTEKDRIVQLGLIIENEDGDIELSKQQYINPEMPISKEATAIHGIRDEDVADKPTFARFAKALKPLFENKLIVGYNMLAFDVPIILAEFERAGVELNLSGKFLDVFKIEKKLSPRTLAATYRNYTGMSLENAHDAMADIEATRTILSYQTNKAAEELAIAEDGYGAKVPTLSDFMYQLSDTFDMVDFYGKFGRDEEGWLVFKFGKHPGKRVIDQPAYSDWILGSDFPAQIKKLIKQDRDKFNKEMYSKTKS